MAACAEILVIDDDATLRNVMAEWLRGAGYLVDIAKGGLQGLSSVGLALPALVITDLYMPRMSGAEVIAELRKRHPETPILAISGQFESEFGMRWEDVITLGASRVLPKPFRRRELLRAVEVLIGGEP